MVDKLYFTNFFSKNSPKHKTCLFLPCQDIKYDLVYSVSFNSSNLRDQSANNAYMEELIHDWKDEIIERESQIKSRNMALIYIEILHDKCYEEMKSTKLSLDDRKVQ